jgi:hypothetical protein
MGISECGFRISEFSQIEILLFSEIPKSEIHIPKSEILTNLLNSSCKIIVLTNF